MDVNTGEIFAVKSILFPRETYGREEQIKSIKVIWVIPLKVKNLKEELNIL